MKKYFLTVSLLFSTILFFLSCKSESPAPFLEVDRTSVELSADDPLVAYLTVTSNRPFTARSMQTEWCKAEIIENEQSGNLKISASRNETVNARTAVVRITGEGTAPAEISVNVVQSGVTPTLSVKENAVELPSGEQEFTLEVTANLHFAFQLPEWISAKEGNIPKTGVKTYTFIAEPFVGTTSRQANIIVSAISSTVNVTQSVIVTQAATAPELSVSDAAVHLPGGPQEFTLEVRSNFPFTFQLPEWIQSKEGSIPETGVKTYTFVVEPFFEGEPRQADIILNSVSPDITATKTVSVTQEKTYTIKTMTFNIRVISGQNDDPIRWDDGRNVLVKRTIMENEIDIVGTQENELRQQTYLIANLTGYQGLGVTNNTGGNNGESNSIFFRTARFTLIKSGKFWLSETPNVAGSKSWDSGYIRMAIWVILEDKTTGRRLFFINTHIDHLGIVTAQRRQVEVLLQKIEELREGLPVILTGDFNMWPNNSNIAVINNSFLVHTRDVAQTTTGLSYSFHGWNNTPLNERYLADYIFAGDGVNVYLHSVMPEKLDGNYVSDHAPVVAIIEN
jgi:endonuclease/exonuclease/phosphatase family metal-dependent hydrolase